MHDESSTMSRAFRKGPAPRPLADRFWLKVDMTADCWLWTASVDTGGYGQIGGGGHRGRHLQAHRVSWELAYGPIPDGMSVLHRCDTPRCVRPEHLFLGNQWDNMADMTGKGRRHQKLTDADIEAILARFAAGDLTADIARDYGVKRDYIRSLAVGKRGRTANR